MLLFEEERDYRARSDKLLEKLKISNTRGDLLSPSPNKRTCTSSNEELCFDFVMTLVEVFTSSWIF